ncbi:sulfurtransferase TusA family protein [Variovorax sp. RB2P76]|uniref:sulfurtransferase TusA family protein n=1 Tax=Variovorax sp. RB2P76 TaxID=3443736 RepID=UPI003F470FD2
MTNSTPNPFLPARLPPAARNAGDALGIDACGTRCPVPVLRLRKALARSVPGQVIRLTTDDPAALASIQQAMDSLPAQLFATRREDDRLIFTVLRQ